MQMESATTYKAVQRMAKIKNVNMPIAFITIGRSNVSKKCKLQLVSTAKGMVKCRVSGATISVVNSMVGVARNTPKTKTDKTWKTITTNPSTILALSSLVWLLEIMATNTTAWQHDMPKYPLFMKSDRRDCFDKRLPIKLNKKFAQ